MSYQYGRDDSGLKISERNMYYHLAKMCEIFSIQLEKF